MNRFAPLVVLAGCAAAEASAPPAAAPPAAAVVAARPSGRAAAAAPAPPEARPAEAAAPEPEPEATPPVVVTVGSRTLTITFVERPARGIASRRDVASVRVDDAVLYPPECASRRTGLCSAAHRHLRSLEGKGQTLVWLRDDVASAPAGPPTRARFFFAAVFHGSPECGAYGFWALRLDVRGARVTEPIEGCFQTPHGQDEDERPSPELVWADPSVLSLWTEGRTSLAVYALAEATFVWRRLVDVRLGPLER